MSEFWFAVIWFGVGLLGGLTLGASFTLLYMVIAAVRQERGGDANGEQ